MLSVEVVKQGTETLNAPSLKPSHCLMGSNSCRQGCREIQHFFEEFKTWDREWKRGVGREKVFVKAPFCPPRHIFTKYHSSCPQESRSHPPSLLQFTPNFILHSPPSFSNPSDGTASIFEKECIFPLSKFFHFSFHYSSCFVQDLQQKNINMYHRQLRRMKQNNKKEECFLKPIRKYISTEEVGLKTIQSLTEVPLKQKGKKCAGKLF